MRDRKLLLVLAIFLAAPLLLSSCSNGDEESQKQPFLHIREKAEKKVDLFSSKKILVLSSSPGKVTLLRNGKPIKHELFSSGDSRHIFHQSPRPGNYQIRVAGSSGLFYKVPPWRVRYPSLGAGSKGRDVALLHSGLRDLGYKNSPRGKTWTYSSSLAVLAFQKTNALPLTSTASPALFRKVMKKEGAFDLREKRSGKYVEVDLGRQVMVLAKDGKPVFTYHISSGAPSTPSDLGRYHFYSKLPGYNSLGMYYSVFYNRGEATHGYSSVPTYPASHGCLRNPVSDSVRIYNWIEIGTPIWVY